MSAALQIRSLRALVFRCPIEAPVVTSFGAMRERPMLLVRAEDASGAVGWGEVWCNFPAVGAEHRARLLESVLGPLVVERQWSSPEEAFSRLSAATAVLALQSGEPGPIAQCIAGVDIALWDLAARKRGEPLWRLFDGRSPRVRVYASGLNPDAPEKLAAERLCEGYRAFKLKIGFGAERDVANLKALRSALGADCELMADANQAWSLEEAERMLRQLAPFDLKWLEEPLRADQPWSDWCTLAARAAMPLAAGENLAGEAVFDSALASGALGVVQPDVGKWGGISGCLAVAKRIVGAGVRYCPHWLGGGVGLAASAQLLAAVGGDGLLEVDANPNPLRALTCGPLAQVVEGAIELSDSPGLGIEPDLGALERYAIPFS